MAEIYRIWCPEGHDMGLAAASRLLHLVECPKCGGEVYDIDTCEAERVEVEELR